MRKDGIFDLAITDGVTVTTGASAGSTIPLNAAGAKPRYIRVSATTESYVKLGVGGVPTATTNSLLIQPADSLILPVGSNTHYATVQGTAVGKVNIAPCEDE